MVLTVEKPMEDAGNRAAAASGLRALCAWAVRAMRTPLPDIVARRAALVLADDIAAITVAAAEPQVAGARAILLRSGGTAEATAFAEGAPRGPREQIAAANGVAMTWAELDEGFRLLPCHAGAYIVPTLLAEAEAADLPLETALRALAVAYDITARIAQAYPFARLTVHPHAAFNAIGAATGIALLRGQDEKTLFATLTSAATMVNPGPFNHAIEGALARNLWTSIGATAGFRAADFAPLGIAGLDGALHDVFADCFGCEPHPAALDAELGAGDWAIQAGYHKIYACCQYTHSAVQAALTLAGRIDDPAEIERIEVDTHSRGLALDVRRPDTVLAAKFSMPHAMAAVAVKGDAGAGAFDTASLTEPTIARLREAVVLRAHDDIRPAPNDRPGRVRWVLRDGRILAAEVASARGGSDQPFSEHELLAKFAALTEPTFPAAGAVLRHLIETGPGPRSMSDFLRELTVHHV